LVDRIVPVIVFISLARTTRAPFVGVAELGDSQSAKTKRQASAIAIMVIIGHTAREMLPLPLRWLMACRGRGPVGGEKMGLDQMVAWLRLTYWSEWRRGEESGLSGLSDHSCREPRTTRDSLRRLRPFTTAVHSFAVLVQRQWQ
jgi:hypothetical protein